MNMSNIKNTTPPLSVALYPTASRFFVSRTFLNRRGMRFALAWTSIHERFAPIGAKVPKTQDVFCFSMAHRRFYHKHCGYDGARHVETKRAADRPPALPSCYEAMSDRVSSNREHGFAVSMKLPVQIRHLNVGARSSAGN